MESENQTNVITLLPCPFCGGEAHAYRNNLWHVGCEHAHNCCVTMSAFATEAEAIAAWNARACDQCGGGAVPMTEEAMEEHGWVRKRMSRMAFGDDMLPECGNCGEPLVYYTRRHGFNAGDKRSACYCPNCGAEVVEP